MSPRSLGRTVLRAPVLSDTALALAAATARLHLLRSQGEPAIDPGRSPLPTFFRRPLPPRVIEPYPPSPIHRRVPTFAEYLAAQQPWLRAQSHGVEPPRDACRPCETLLKVLGNFLTFSYRVSVRRVFFDVTGTPLPLTSASVDAANAIANFLAGLDPADTQYDAAFQAAMDAAASELNVVLNALTPIALAAHQPSPAGGGPLRELFRCSSLLRGHAFLLFSLNSIRTDMEFIRTKGPFEAAFDEGGILANLATVRFGELEQHWTVMGDVWSSALAPLQKWEISPAPVNETGAWYTFGPFEAAYLASMNIDPLTNLGW
jgi:hypothetical protein